MEEKFYEIENNTIKIFLNKNIYPLVVVKKTISNYLDVSWVKIEEEFKNIVIYMRIKEKNIDELNEIVGEFYNNLLRESLRYDISIETKSIRELILGRALYSTCIDTEEETNNKEIVLENKISEENNIEDIAINWFKKEEES